MRVPVRLGFKISFLLKIDFVRLMYETSERSGKVGISSRDHGNNMFSSGHRYHIFRKKTLMKYCLICMLVRVML